MGMSAKNGFHMHTFWEHMTMIGQVYIDQTYGATSPTQSLNTHHLLRPSSNIQLHSLWRCLLYTIYHGQYLTTSSPEG